MEQKAFFNIALIFKLCFICGEFAASCNIPRSLIHLILSRFNSVLRLVSGMRIYLAFIPLMALLYSTFTFFFFGQTNSSVHKSEMP